MYAVLIFLHLLSIFAFMLAHGASAVVMFKLRAERDPARLHALLDLSQSMGGAMALTAAVILLTGLIGGFIGNWWGQGWIWLSLALFLVISTVMALLGRPYLERVRTAIGIGSVEARRKKLPLPPALPPEQLPAVLASGRPELVAAVGLGGLALITWLMMYKPF